MRRFSSLLIAFAVAACGASNPTATSLDVASATTGGSHLKTPSGLCGACTSDADCAHGSHCVVGADEGSACTVPCDASNTCAAGLTCFPLTLADGSSDHGCFPTNASCTAYGTSSTGSTGSTSSASSSTGSTGEASSSSSSTSSTTGSSGSTGSGQCGTDTWNNYAENFFSTNCVHCHSFMSSQTAVKASKTSITSKLENNAMPPGGGLNADDVTRIVNWLACGAP